LSPFWHLRGGSGTVVLLLEIEWKVLKKNEVIKYEPEKLADSAKQ